MRPVDTGDHYLQAAAMDQPGAGGANHYYEIGCLDAGTLAEVRFQNGPIKEAGINGVTHEALLCIVADRLRSFQAGPFACSENALALQGVEAALFWLSKRTADRQARSVEGTNQL
jgi:hypothetical protein